MAVVLLMVGSATPVAGAGASTPIAHWRAPYSGGTISFSYLAATAPCAHASFGKRPTFHASDGAGSFAANATSLPTGCRYTGIQEVAPWVDWIYNSSTFRASGTTRIEATWVLSWSAFLFAGAPFRGAGCPTCVAKSRVTIGVWIEAIDLTTGTYPCPMPCPEYNWSVQHIDRDSGTYTTTASNRTVRVVYPNVSFVRGDVYQVYTGVEAYLLVGARGNGSHAYGALTMGSGRASPGVRLIDVRVS